MEGEGEGEGVGFMGVEGLDGGESKRNHSVGERA